MAVAKKYKYSKFVTPVGIAKYSWLREPDQGFNGQGEPKYKVRIVIDNTKEHRDWVKNVLSTAQAEAKTHKVKIKDNFNNPFRFPEDQDPDDYEIQEGKERPRLDEDHKERIFFEMKSAYPPALLDTKRQTLPINMSPMGGDKIRCSFIVNPYELLGSGISLRLSGVQLIEKDTSFSSNAGSEFGDIDGYVAEAESDEDF